jgi:glycosyltransferase involved in cell wall biosynthesis
LDFMSDGKSGRVHLVMISGHAPPVMDGVGDCAAPLLSELARQRPEWRWTWLSRRPGWHRSPIAFACDHVKIRPNHTWSERGRRVACETLRLLRPGLVHIQDQIHSYFETDAAARLASAAGCPVVTTLHEYHVELPSVVQTDALVRLSDAVIANDARNADRCQERTGREVDARWWSGSTVAPIPRRPVADLVTTFGFLTALTSVAGPLGGLSRLRETGTPLRWRIIGPFDPQGNPEHAKMAELADLGWVEFAGGFSVRDPRLTRMLAESRVMILPYADGASLRRTTLHAAWAFGIPVITTPPPHHEPAIVDGENCLLVREPSVGAWAEALSRLLGDPALEARLSAGGLATAKTLGWPELARRHLELYDGLLARRAGGTTS